MAAYLKNSYGPVLTETAVSGSNAFRQSAMGCRFLYADHPLPCSGLRNRHPGASYLQKMHFTCRLIVFRCPAVLSFA